MRRFRTHLSHGVCCVVLMLMVSLALDVAAKNVVLSGRKDLVTQFKFKDANYIIRTTLDLKGSSLQIPEGVTLVFEGGKIVNGTLVGDQTRVRYSGTIFSGVTIKGEWLVSDLKSSMFADIDKPDGLKNLFALSNDLIENNIVIEKGDYRVSAPANTKGALEVRSKSKVNNKGRIRLQPNDFTGCSVLRISNVSDVVISGDGSILGDKSSHKGSKGEWGMGIQIMGSRNILIENISVSDCWGDCVYIGGNSSKVIIRDCELSNARRQGISVTYASNCMIENCRIHDIGGTAPEYAIDFEPNANSSVHQMTVKDCIIYNCKGGIIAGIKGITAVNASVGDIKITGCKVYGLRTQNTFRWHNCSNIVVENCIIDRPLKKCTFKVDAKKVEYRNMQTRKL